MGRVKLSVPTGNFTIRTKPNKQGEVTVYLIYNVGSVTIPRSTGVKVQLSDWDIKKQQVRTKNPASARLNNILKLQRAKVDKQIELYDGVLTPDIVGQMMDGKFLSNDKKNEQKDFIDYAIKYNKQRYNLEEIAYSTYYNADLYIKKFQKFIVRLTNEPVIYISDLTLDIFEKYKSSRLKDGNSKEGINKMLTPLLKAVEYAKNNELISIKVASSIINSYFDLKERKYKSDVEDDEVNYLTLNQLSQFVKMYHNVKYDRTRELMDMFLFAFHACGLRVSDIITLEWKHIDWIKCEISKNLFKGNVPHNIPLTEAAMKILLRWREKGYNCRFVFDLLPENFDLTDEALLDKKRLSKNRVLGMSLNAIGLKMGLPFSLSMHIARHSFAVLALSRGVTIHMISRLLGHGSIVTTEKVYAKFLPDSVTTEVITKLSFNEIEPAA